MKDKSKQILISLGLVLVIFTSGVFVGYSQRPEVDKVVSLINKKPVTEKEINFAPFWKTWNILEEKSIDKISEQDRVWGAIAGLAKSSDDPYTVFFSPKENELFKDSIQGSFSGIGAEVGMKKGVLTIIAPLKDSPAYNAGIKSGDKIIEVDGEDTIDISIDKALSMIRGKKGTTVALTVYRSGIQGTQEIKIIRDTIQIPTIDTELRDDGIFVISFYSFSENSVNLFREALIEFSSAKTDKLIIDLRGNPGGYLDAVVNIASWFIDEGKVIVRENFGDKSKEQAFRSHGPRIFTDDLKLVILIDQGSASASEIMAGALREHNIATLVGEKTFGKGSIQELIDITDNTSLKVTVGKWLTPNGISISENGLEPDVKVEYTLEDYENDRDSQFDKAVEILLK
ncbi:MAG: S41 family peptidase [Patescibacteria group bacterium]|nr:S41 family peptidase [Patescibacteria group bacterium]